MVCGVFILNFIISIIMFIILKNKIQDSGFTLMEAVVTVGIIMIMSAVYLANYRASNQKIILDQATAGLTTDLRLAQNMALNVKTFNGVIPEGGYGINIAVSSPGAYTIYADCDAGYDYDSGSCSSGGATEKVFDRTLTSGVNVSAVDFGDLDFVPPFAAVYIDGAAPAAGSATITLRYGGAGGPVKTITINRITGQINASN